MPFQNRRGRRVDPVPFLVATLVVGLVVLSYGPGYLLALGFSLPVAVTGSVSASAVVAGVAYYRLVWEAYPDARKRVPAELRVRRLAYLVLAGGLLLVLLAIPLYAQWR